MADIPHFRPVSVLVKFTADADIIKLIFFFLFVMKMVHYLSILNTSCNILPRQNETTLTCGAQWPMVSIQNAYFPDIRIE